jgi:hypothetical protein
LGRSKRAAPPVEMCPFGTGSFTGCVLLGDVILQHHLEEEAARAYIGRFIRSAAQMWDAPDEVEVAYLGPRGARREEYGTSWYPRQDLNL